MVTAFELEELVRDARARTGVPGVAAGFLHGGSDVELVADGVLELGRHTRVRPDTPFRIASVSKPFTSALCVDCLPLDERLRALLSHTAGLRCESLELLPEEARGLFSYSNAGYSPAAEAASAACGTSFEDAMRARILAPLGLDATGYEEPAGAARGHVQEGESGHRPVASDRYPPQRRPAGGLWSTVGDLLAFAAHQLAAPSAAHEPQVEALGASYALGWWVRELPNGHTVLDHEGSVAGYQSLLLLVPAERFALAVLTNSWRGSGLIRRIVDPLVLLRREPASTGIDPEVAGTYALDGRVADVEAAGGGLLVTERERDPVTGTETVLRYPVRETGGGVFAFAHGALMSHRVDFPRPGVARIGWTALRRAGEAALPAG
jgi:CubicO group peptidase (beta-lactamase class C family)